MKDFVLICFFTLIIIFFYSTVIALETEKIVGGDIARQYQFKYQVSIQFDGEHFCGGGILEDGFIITAAHCIYDFNTGLFIQQLIVIIANILNERKVSKFTVICKVVKIYIHRSYQNVVTENLRLVGDIAILKLDKKLGLAKDTALSKLDRLEQDIPLVGEIAVIAGYGSNEMTVYYDNVTKESMRDGSGDGMLRYARVSIISNADCNEVYGPVIQDDNLCGYVIQRDPNRPEGTCKGDSGSPLVYDKNLLIGIAIGGPPDCRENLHPGVYTRISHYSAFIKNAMDNIITPDMIVAELTKINVFGSAYQTISNLAGSVEVHFESKDGGFFLKHSPRQLYPSNLRPDLSTLGGGPAAPSTSSSQQQQQQGSSVLSIDKFTVFQTSEPVSVRATYGPFSTKQTVPARYIVPDPLDVLPLPELKKANASGGLLGPGMLDVQELGARHLDMSAHLVSSSIPRDSPVLRVLFHAGSEATGRRQLLLGRHQRICVLLHASPTTPPPGRAAEPLPGATDGPLTAACSPDGQDGVCLAQITLPAAWWPPLPPPDTAGRVKPVKTLPRMVQLSYSVLEPRGPDEADSGHGLEPGSGPFCQPKVQIQPVTALGQVSLAPNRATYKELKTDEYLTLLVPHGPLYPRSRLHVPVFLQSHSSKLAGQGRPPVAAVVLRARVKAGVKILDASSSSPDWIVETDINTKNTAATFTAKRKENVSRLPNASAEEIMTMLLEASEESTEGKEHAGGRIVWSVRYALEGEEDNVSFVAPFQPAGQQHHHHQAHQQAHQQQQQQQLHHHHHGLGPGDRRKLQAHLEIQKDDIQAVLPISKNWEVMNTAVLTGRQISQAMKVFIVSQAGTVADVTLQSSCHSEDESVLKVSSSCSSVYVDGSEIRGSSNASVLVKYGTYTGLARFTVWMPEFPLEVSVTDTRLNQIKGWKVPEEHHPLTKNKRSLNASEAAEAKQQQQQREQQRRGGGGGTASEPATKEEELDYDEEDELEAGENGEELAEGKVKFRGGGGGGGSDKWDEINAIDRGAGLPNCRLRFQQSPVEVHARFLAADHDSGRVSYFVNRRTWLRVTDLVAGLLRVSDPRIAILVQGRIVQGRGIGRTEVQVLSPITGRVIGAKEVRVGSDRVTVSHLSVKVVSGLQLIISPDSAIENGYVAETSVTRKLTAQYQEGLLDIDIEFSDGTRTPLRDISVNDYQLGVESTNPEVVAFAPMVASHHPRVIAVGEGRGDLLRVSLKLTDSCQLALAGRRTKSVAGRAVAAAAAAAAAAASSSSATASAPAVLPLATASANVEVDFASSDLPSRPEFVQNDGGGNLVLGGHQRERKAGRELAPDLQDILMGGMGGVGVRHGVGPRMTPLEIGMYVLLAAFCFAIVVFVVSCVVYASKFKPQPTESELPSLPVIGAARAAASQFNQNRNRPRESTTNAHDWVWLGRATLERAACAPHQVRVTSNPLAVEAEDETLDLGTSFDNPNHVELPSAARARTSTASTSAIDTTTYCKRDKAQRSEARNDNDAGPPPLPPHKPGTKHSPASADNGNAGEEDYKPPVPPHRNTGAPTSRGPPDTPRRRAHHRHQRANSGSSGGERADGGGKGAAAAAAGRRESGKHHLHHHHHRAGKSSRSKSGGSASEQGRAAEAKGIGEPAFVEVRSRDGDSRGKRARSREIKRATVVGNPMFSSSSSESSGSLAQAPEDDQRQQGNASTSGTTATTAAAGSGLGLDDLNLGMDYNQIMQYFESLKESNA